MATLTVTTASTGSVSGWRRAAMRPTTPATAKPSDGGWPKRRRPATPSRPAMSTALTTMITLRTSLSAWPKSSTKTSLAPGWLDGDDEVADGDDERRRTRRRAPR